ncbi:MAG: hypothetical protein WA708_05690 [Acidobacteriaceae bacterium]
MAAVCIVLLLFWSLESALHAVWLVIREAFWTTYSAFFQWGIPGGRFRWDMMNRFLALGVIAPVLHCLLLISAAWLISHWVCGKPPLDILAVYWSKLQGRENA